MHSKIYYLGSIILMILIAAFVACDDDDETAVPLNLDEATHKVLADVLDNNLDSLLFYRYDSLITPADFIIAPKQAFAPDDDSWFFFVDDAPGDRWAHPCRWIFVNSLNGDVTTIDESWPPENLDDFTLYYTRDLAVEKVISDIMFDSLESKDLYYTPGIIQAGRRITNPYGGSYEAEKDSWFLFIDDLPEAFYAHDCRYVFVEIWGGDATVYDEQWPPELELIQYEE